MIIRLPIKIGEWSVDHDIDQGWHYWHENHDGAPDGCQDLHGSCNTLDDCLDEILDYEIDLAWTHGSKGI